MKNYEKKIVVPSQFQTSCALKLVNMIGSLEKSTSPLSPGLLSREEVRDVQNWVHSLKFLEHQPAGLRNEASAISSARNAIERVLNGSSLSIDARVESIKNIIQTECAIVIAGTRKKRQIKY